MTTGVHEPSAGLPAGLSTGALRELVRCMALIRASEERLLELFSEGRLSGTTHTSIGQEAVAAAVGAHLASGDPVFSTHRCHGHYLAYGGPLVELLAEIMGRDSELCGGRGGSQHLHWRDFHSNGIQGGVVGNATGMALAEKLKGSGAVAVGFMGDGTLGEGLVYESLNFASLRSLPLLLVLEHNGYSQSTPARLAVAGSVTSRAAAFDVAADEVTTNDVADLWKLFGRRFGEVRRTGRPFVQVVHTYRLSPHSKGDDDRPAEELDAWRERDPLVMARRRLPAEVVGALEREARETVARAVQEADRRPHPSARRARPAPAVPPGTWDVPWVREPRPYVDALRDGLARLLEKDERCFVIGEDVLDPYGGAFKATKGLSTRFPERVLATPLSEAGIVAWGTGAALRGLRPLAEIMFGDFVTLAADQLVNHAAKYRWVYADGVQVPLVVRTPMGGRRGYGPTHSQSLEAMFVGMPGLCVVAPSHLLHPGELLWRAGAHTRDPVLFVENKLLYARRLLASDGRRVESFFVRGATDSCFPTLRLGLAEDGDPDAMIVCYGGSAPLALDAARELLVNHEVLCDVVVPSCVSPVPVEEVASLAGRCPRIVSLEEGPVGGGWGAELVAALGERFPVAGRSFARVGAPDSPIPSSKALEDELMPGIADVATAVLARA